MPDQEKRRWWQFGRRKQPDGLVRRPRVDEQSRQPGLITPSARDDCAPMLKGLHWAAAIGCALVIAYSVQFHGTGESLKIAAIGIAIAGSALFLGFLAGFIFCIPRAAKRDALNKERSVSTPADQSTASSAPGTDSFRDNSGNRFDDNSNLVEISDWVTKILVGAGLVELTRIPPALWRFCAKLAPGLGTCGSTACTDASQAFALALLLFFFPIGFLTGYIWTRLYYQETLSNLKRQLVAVSKDLVDASKETKIQQSINEAGINLSYGKFDDAFANINYALDLDPHNGRALFERGRIQKRMAEKPDKSFDKDLLQKALADMTEAARLMPKKGPPIYNMACYQALLGRPPQEVLATLKDAFDKDPTLKKTTSRRSPAAYDTDFDSLKDNNEFQTLVGIKPE